MKERRPYVYRCVPIIIHDIHICIVQSLEKYANLAGRGGRGQENRKKKIYLLQCLRSAAGVTREIRIPVPRIGKKKQPNK